MSGLIVETDLSNSQEDTHSLEDRDDWMPVEVTPRSAKCSMSDVKHEIGVIKANVQFLLDRVLTLEGLVERLIGSVNHDKKTSQ